MDSKSRTNPLILAAVAAAIAAAGAAYQLLVQASLNPLPIIRLAAFLLFLALYFLKSRFAWHMIALAVLVVTPLYVLLPGMQSKSVRPETIWSLVILSVICLVYLWRVRQPYFRFLQDRTNSCADSKST